MLMEEGLSKRIRHPASIEQKASMLPPEPPSRVTAGVTPKSAPSGERSHGRSRILESVSKMECKMSGQTGQGQNMCSKSAGVCLHLSQAGSMSG